MHGCSVRECLSSFQGAPLTAPVVALGAPGCEAELEEAEATTLPLARSTSV